MPRDFGLLPEAVQEKIDAINPGYLEELIRGDLTLRGFTVTDELITTGLMDYRAHEGKGNFQDIADFIENEYLTEDPENILENEENALDTSEQTVGQSENEIPVTETAQVTPRPLMIIPPPVFFINWDEAQFDFDLNLYNDHDIIGYDKSGVEHALGRSGNLNYVTSTGVFWGGNEVPGNIYEQITAYQNGEVSDEQVRQNYLNELEAFTNYRAADLEKSDAELIEVLDNGIIADSEKNTISGLLENGISNVDLTAMLSAAYTGETSATLLLKSGETANFTAYSNGLEIEIPNKDHRMTAWNSIAPIVRSLAQKWVNEPEAERPAAEQETLPQQQTISAPERERSDVWYHVGDMVYFNNSEYEIIEIADSGMVTTRDANGDLRYDSPQMFDALTHTDDRSRQLRSSRLLAPDVTQSETQTKEEKFTRIPSANFRITDDHLGDGGAKTKFRNNIDAIKTLQAIEFENHAATPEEQEILSRYIGWGGLPQAFDPDNKQWTNEYLELNAALSPEEFESAQASTLNAHYARFVP